MCSVTRRDFILRLEQLSPGPRVRPRYTYKAYIQQAEWVLRRSLTFVRRSTSSSDQKQYRKCSSSWVHLPVSRIKITRQWTRVAEPTAGSRRCRSHPTLTQQDSDAKVAMQKTHDNRGARYSAIITQTRRGSLPRHSRGVEFTSDILIRRCYVRERWDRVVVARPGEVEARAGAAGPKLIQPVWSVPAPAPRAPRPRRPRATHFATLSSTCTPSIQVVPPSRWWINLETKSKYFDDLF